MADLEAREEGEAASSARVRIGGLGAAIGLFALVWALPIPFTIEQHRLLAIFAAVLVLWVTEALPIAVTALAIAPAMIACGITSADDAFSPYADPLLFLFVGGFFLARAMTRHGLDRRIALAIVGSRFVKGRARAAFMFTTFTFSMWISNTATAAIVTPIALGMLGKKGTDDRAASGTVMGIAFAASLGGLGTLIGSPPNLITARALEAAHVHLGFVGWTQVGFPICAAMTLASYLLFSRTHPEPNVVEAPRTDALPPMSRSEKITAGCFALAVALWVIPSVLAGFEVPFGVALDRALPLGASGIVATLPLFFFRDEKRSTVVLPWSDAAQIDWGIILLFGGGISLGDQMFATGLARRLGEGFVEITGVSSLFSLTVIAAVSALILTEVCSNTASANMLAPIVVGIAERLHVSVIPPVLAVGLAASCGFMLPVATGPNAIAFGTGRVPLRDMIRSGVVLDLVCILIVIGFVPLLCMAYGWW